MSGVEPPKATLLGRLLGIPKLRRWEGPVIRFVFALVVFTTLPLERISGNWLFGYDGWLAPTGRVDYDSQPVETGIAKFFDLTFMSNEALQPWLWVISVVCLIAYVWGRGLVIALPVVLAITVCARTLENSQGFMFHKYQIVSTVLLMQTAAVLVCFVWDLCLRWRGKQARWGNRLDDVMVRYSQIGIIGAYMLAGIAKVDNSDGEWVANSPYFGLDAVRTHRQEYYAHLEGERFAEIPQATWMLESPMRTRVLMGLGLLLEFICVFALFHRVLALVMGVLLVSFHVQIAALMTVHFIYNEIIVYIFLVNPVFWIGAGGLWLWNKARGDRGEPRAVEA